MLSFESGLASLAVDFQEKSSAKRRIEESRKVLIPGTGTASGTCGTGSMCVLDIGKKFPLSHFVAWREALLRKNLGNAHSLDAAAKASVRRAGYEVGQ